ncbi:MAG TPA: hypothetical protein VGE69_14055 [Pseudomonadales bacterium]
MHPNDHARLNACWEKIASVPIEYHPFLRRLKHHQSHMAYRPLSQSARAKLSVVHNLLVTQGLVDPVAA